MTILSLADAKYKVIVVIRDKNDMTILPPSHVKQKLIVVIRKISNYFGKNERGKMVNHLLGGN